MGLCMIPFLISDFFRLLFLFFFFLFIFQEKKRVLFFSRLASSFFAQKREEKETRLFAKALPDLLFSYCSFLRSGFNLYQSCELVAEESHGVVKRECEHIIYSVQSGSSLSDAFLQLAQRRKDKEVEMFCQSVVIFSKSGGDLSALFEELATTLQARRELAQKILQHTSQAKWQGIILLCMPFFFLLGFMLFAPRYYAPFFESSLGAILLSFIFLLELVGAFLLKKILKVAV